ncbi:hypothetical protein HQ584_05945 [Patescibacteria group bacterium]|nr:hypothetical protein [Patescibacteria group bacterium]
MSVKTKLSLQEQLCIFTNNMIRIITLLILLITVGAGIVQAEQIIHPTVIPKSKEEFSLEEIGERTTIAIPALKIENISNSWGPVLSDTTTIVTQVLVSEPSLSLVSLAVSCSVYLNGIKMTEGLGEDLTIERVAEGSLVRFNNKINNNSENIAKWWASHIKNGERTKAIIKGKLIINLGGVDLAYPFSWKNEFQTDMLGDINTTDVSNFSFGLYTLQIQSLDSEWGKITTKETQIKYTIKIYNSSKIPGAPIINRIEYDFLLNGIKMAEGGTGLPLVIWPGKTESVVFTIKMDSRKLKAWWISHIKSHERTSYQFQYYLLVKFLGTTLARWPKEVEGGFETDFLALKSSQ